MNEKLKNLIPSLILLPVVLFLIINKGKFIFIIDHVNLLIHEGGHGIFKFFGRFLHAFGGTLMQIILPALFIVTYVRMKKQFAVQLSLIWLAQNMMNISVYVSDARDRKLPLLGGNKVYHDWTYLLNEMNLMLYDKLIGSIIYYSAAAILIFTLLYPLFIKEYKEVKLDLNL
jgi:hypothetical protein